MRRPKKELNVEPNVTPLCDAAMTLIIVFIMTLPAVMWSGFKFEAPVSRKGEKKQVQQEAKKQRRHVAVQITLQGLSYNGIKTSPSKLLGQLREWAADLKVKDKDVPEDKREKRMVVILPDDNVQINQIVRVMDIAKMAGAEKLAMLEP